jgi:hypothetical protein
MITFLLTVILATVLLLALLTYTLYCYEESNQSGKPLGPCLALAAKTTLRSIASEILILDPASRGPVAAPVEATHKGQGNGSPRARPFSQSERLGPLPPLAARQGFRHGLPVLCELGHAVGRNGGRRSRRPEKPAGRTSGPGRAPGRAQHGRPPVVVGPGAA